MPPARLQNHRRLGRRCQSLPDKAGLPYGGSPVRDFNTEAYDRIDDNAFRRVADDPLSTFSIDVDTASYANVRRFLNGGSLPPRDAVRIEELINYFRFDYARPTRRRCRSRSRPKSPRARGTRSIAWR